MKVCYVLISIGWGGAEQVTYELIKNLINNGVSVTLLINQEIVDYFSSIQGINIVNIGNLYNTSELLKKIIFPTKITTTHKKQSSSTIAVILNELFRPILFLRIKNYLNALLDDQEVKIIHSHLKNADILVYLLKTDLKCFSTIHGLHILSFLNEKKRLSFFNKLNKRLLEKSLARMDHIIFVSDFLCKSFENKIKFDIYQKSSVIHNGVDISHLKKLTGNKTLYDKEFNGFKMLFPGGAKHSKGGDILIVALGKIKNKIRDFRLFVALDVPEDHFIKQMVEKKGLNENIIFLGFLEKKKYINILNSVDILVMPSRREGFSIAQLEAMALGKPIIAGKTGGTPELIKNYRNGILVLPEPEDLSHAILELYENKNLRDTLSKNNLSDIEKFDWKKIIKEYIHLYETTTSK